jgi:hypothetical protein
MGGVNDKYKNNYYIGPSKIHGNGLMANRNFRKGQIIGVVVYYSFNLFPQITGEFGSWVNHSYNPNSQLYYRDNRYYLVAIQDIYGNQEIVANYNHTPWFIKKPEHWYR